MLAAVLDGRLNIDTLTQIVGCKSQPSTPSVSLRINFSFSCWRLFDFLFHFHAPTEDTAEHRFRRDMVRPQQWLLEPVSILAPERTLSKHLPQNDIVKGETGGGSE